MYLNVTVVDNINDLLQGHQDLLAGTINLTKGTESILIQIIFYLNLIKCVIPCTST